jgi:hypothetical protein
MIIKDFKGHGKISIRIANLTKNQKQALLSDGKIEDVEVYLEIDELKVNEK